MISIHAPLAGCDVVCGVGCPTPSNFNPRTPCGVRLDVSFIRAIMSDFNPRTPCGVRLVRTSFILLLPVISIHAPLAGCDFLLPLYQNRQKAFQSTHPLRGATSGKRVHRSVVDDFNPRTPCGVRQPSAAEDLPPGNFNPRTPCGVRLAVAGQSLMHNQISIHAPLAGCDLHQSRYSCARSISIHAPLAGCDRRSGRDRVLPLISIHAPLAGCDRDMEKFIKRQRNFNPRTPCGVRLRADAHKNIRSDFNPRTPCGVRRLYAGLVAQPQAISIHAPLAGCDISLRRMQWRLAISIHAPLAGCDSNWYRGLPAHIDFNPRTPCGVRLCKRDARSLGFQFQSTHPLRGATLYAGLVAQPQAISIHAPLAGCDVASTSTEVASWYFNPRTPCGVRHEPIGIIISARLFQSTHPLRGATAGAHQSCKCR